MLSKDDPPKSAGPSSPSQIAPPKMEDEATSATSPNASKASAPNANATTGTGDVAYNDTPSVDVTCLYLAQAIPNTVPCDPNGDRVERVLKTQAPS